MLWLRRCLVSVFVLPALLAPSGAADAADEAIDDIPGAVTALDRAALDAILRAGETPADWRPVGAAAGTEPRAGTSLLGVGSAAFTLDDSSLLDIRQMEVLRGPQGVLFGNDRTVLGNAPTAEFYETNPAATVVVAEVEGWPPRDLNELFELALAFTWSGDEVLDDSPYPGDPLIGFGNVSSHGWIDGAPFVNYAKIQTGVWTPYSDPLLRFETTTSDDRHFIGWMLPGVPEALSVAISYSPDATIDTMIAQRVDVPLPDDIASYPLTSDFNLLDNDVQTAFGTLFATSAADDEEQGAAAETGDATTPPSTEEPARNTTDEVSAGSGAVDTGDPNELEVGAEDGGINPLWFVLIPVGAALAWLLYRWLYAGRKRRTPVSAPPDDEPQGVDHSDSDRSWVVDVADRCALDGRPATEDGWLAPTFHETASPGESPGGEPGAWSGIFVNSLTFERVGMADPRYDELLDRFGFRPPVEYAPVTHIEDDVTLGSDRGEETTRPANPTPPTGEPPALRSHAGPSQVMTASEEALGIADAMVGVVVDGWHLLPWDVGSEFFVREGQEKAYRTIPVANREVATDVDFLGEPTGFEPDSSRFAYWMSEDGVLKIGSPSDPHAFPIGAEPRPLESLLPMPGPGESLQDIFVARVVRAHELTGGALPVDGWIAPSNEARTVAMLSDASSSSGYDPDAWSGHFLNIDTGEWLDPGQLGYDDMMRKLGVRPPPKPVESTDTFDLDDTPGAL